MDYPEDVKQETEKIRTALQNRALHKYIRDVANEMANNGHSLNVILKPTFEIPSNEKTFKHVIVHPLIKAIFGIESTKDMTTKQINELYDIINKQVGEHCQIHIPFPNTADMHFEELDKLN
jgi:hypothetical protein